MKSASLSALALLLTVAAMPHGTAAVIVHQVSLPAHRLGSPAAWPLNLGFASRAIDLDTDGHPDLVLAEQTLCTSDVPTSGCVSILFAQGVRGTEVAHIGNARIEAHALVGSTIRNSVGESFGVYGEYSQASLSLLHAHLLPPVSNDLFNPFGEGRRDGYVAFRMADEAGGYRYGYLHLDYQGWPGQYADSPYQAIPPVVIGWSYESSSNTPVSVTPIPEPRTLLLLAAGLLLPRRSRDRHSSRFPWSTGPRR